MKRNFGLWLVDNCIKRVHRITKKYILNDLTDFKTNKDIYIILKWLKFPRKVEFKLYNNMQAFEMASAQILIRL